ncbi:MAG: DMT family transporter [Hyphomicrobium sp.]|nr:DMT family transporter [Hyphomicrobium sp.]
MSAQPQPGPGAEARAVAAAAFGSSLVGTVPYFAIGLSQAGIDVAVVLFWRYWIALAVLIPLAWWTSPGLRTEWMTAGRGLFLNGITLGLAQTYTYFRAVQTVPSSVVVTVFFVYPMITLAFDRYLYALQIRWQSVVAVALIFVGALLAGWPSFGLGDADPIGLLCVIATPVIFSIYIAIAYRYTRQASPFAGASAIYLGLGCGYGLVVALFGMKAVPALGNVPSLLAIGLVGGAIQIASFAYALPRLSAGRYSIIVSLELVTVVLIGVLLLGEQLTPVQFAGIGLVAIGIIADRLVRAKR